MFVITTTHENESQTKHDVTTDIHLPDTDNDKWLYSGIKGFGYQTEINSPTKYNAWPLVFNLIVQVAATIIIIKILMSIIPFLTN